MSFSESLSPTVPPLSVSELTAQIKQLLEQGFSRIRVSGEISRLTARSGGHVYFTIKDAHASLSAVIWKSTVVRLVVQPEEGRKYIFHGHLSLYPPQGRYQLVVSRLEEEGSGELAAEFERRKRLFAERGWFDSAKKHKPPALPRHIGIVTSDSAAALQDVKKVLATRPGWLQLTLSPTPVQGTGAISGIGRALHRLQNLPEPPDVVLLVRGGGSPEDLWCFNDEAVVRAIVECPIPVVTGIGHDIDTTLADFAADAHAATPSNAAEIACPASETLRQQMPRIRLLQQLLQQSLGHARKSTRQAAQGLQHRWRSMRDERRMHAERMNVQLVHLARQKQQRRRQALRLLEKRLLPQEPGHQLRLRQRRLDEGLQRLQVAVQQRWLHAERAMGQNMQSLRRLQDSLITHAHRQLEVRQGRLAALGPHAVLKRGYTMAMLPDGQLLHSVEQMHLDDTIKIRFHDGSADARVHDIHPDARNGARK